ncbi:MAG: hypothetical protein M3Q40_01925 [Pseudomonadota bacterium]|nr:hypothetical protein [Pseudomonadota bacterium]
MNPLVELNLSLILFLPWFVILGGLFWAFPRQPRDAARQAFDAVALAASAGAFLASIHWSYYNADPGHGPMWKQILATALGYAVFLAVLALATWLRSRWLRQRAGP